jgi:hypothetical protein
MVGRKVVLYYAWSRPGEVEAPPEVIKNRFPTLFESRRMLYPGFEAFSDPARFSDTIIMVNRRDSLRPEANVRVRCLVWREICRTQMETRSSAVTPNHIRHIFKSLETRDGTAFFARVADDVDWTVMGAAQGLGVLEMNSVS